MENVILETIVWELGGEMRGGGRSVGVTDRRMFTFKIRCSSYSFQLNTMFLQLPPTFLTV